MPDETPPPRPVRYIKPLGPRILVRILEQEDRSSGGLILPQGVMASHADALYGEVVEVARAEPGPEEPMGQNVSGVPLGVRVLFPKEEGLRVPWDDELRLLEVKSVYATVEEVERDALQ